MTAATGRIAAGAAGEDDLAAMGRLGEESLAVRRRQGGQDIDDDDHGGTS